MAILGAVMPFLKHGPGLIGARPSSGLRAGQDDFASSLSRSASTGGGFAFWWFLSASRSRPFHE